ncbi:MAG: 3'-5' exonuclease [Asticcacaulis sp.]|uniref:3'-5' exonuclease n=1 Tax=Asticcacaulis sp. TaxID=1872648 RepID=UPI0039E51769
MKFIAIDFETANEQRGSACSVGLAWIENNEITRVEERLIRPKDMRFSGMNIAIHGIRPEHVQDAPEFPIVMDEFRHEFRSAVMIAHNAAFDMSVIRNAYDQYGLAYPEFDYLCTLQMSRKVWSGFHSHRLSDLSEHLGFQFKHHNAAEDAAMCGRVALAIAKELGVAHIGQIPKLINMSPGRLHSAGYKACSCPPNKRKSLGKYSVV